MQLNAKSTIVLYDGSCPICSREIKQYRKGDSQGEICWLDISSPNFVAPAGQNKETLMQRFHVIRPDGSMVSGAPAFIHLWEQLPGWKNVARLARFPGILSLLDFSYEKFLIYRPKLQKIFS